MKTLFLGVCLFLGYFVSAQLKSTVKCNSVVVDVLNGKVNGAEPDFTPGQVKGLLPCFTSEEPETEESQCGGGVFYKDKDLYFFTGRDYIEIREKFNGKLSIPIMGAARNSLFKWLGHPKAKDVTWDVFSTSYGILIVNYNKANKVNKIQLTIKSMETINLCN